MSKFALKRLNNAAAVDTLGYEKLISTQTEIVSGVIATKYYELLGQSLSDFVPFDVGRGSYSTNIFQYTSAYLGSPFEAGLVQPSSGLGINAKSTIAIDGITIKNNFWRMDYEVSHEVIEMGKVNVQAFSIIEENEKARKKVYDLGMQDVTFKGLNDGATYGLLNQPNVTVNTSLFPKRLANMTAEELSTFAATAVATYLANNNTTAMLNRMMIPTADFVALSTPSNPEFPLKTKLNIIEEAFKGAGATDFKIVHSTYNEKADSTGSKARYVLYRYDADSVRMYIPLQYTPHALYPMNGIDFVSVAEAQFTGVQVLREKEMLYCDAQA